MRNKAISIALSAIGLAAGIQVGQKTEENGLVTLAVSHRSHHSPGHHQHHPGIGESALQSTKTSGNAAPKETPNLTPPIPVKPKIAHPALDTAIPAAKSALSKLSAAVSTPSGPHLTIKIVNDCEEIVWPVFNVESGSPFVPQKQDSGFELAQGASHTVIIPAGSVINGGRILGRQNCSEDKHGTFKCSVADCKSGSMQCGTKLAASGATLAEIATTPNDELWYNLSIIDGFNLAMKIETPSKTFTCDSHKCAPSQAYHEPTPRLPPVASIPLVGTELTVTFCPRA